MRPHALGPLALLLALAPLTGCDHGGPDVPDAGSLVGDYALVRYGGAPLPNGGVSGGALTLQIEETVPVYDIEWTQNGARVAGEGLYTVTGNTVGFFGSVGAGTFDHSGVIEGDRITISVNDGTFTTFTFERD